LPESQVEQILTVFGDILPEPSISRPNVEISYPAKLETPFFSIKLNILTFLPKK